MRNIEKKKERERGRERETEKERKGEEENRADRVIQIYTLVRMKILLIALVASIMPTSASSGLPSPPLTMSNGSVLAAQECGTRLTAESPTCAMVGYVYMTLSPGPSFSCSPSVPTRLPHTANPRVSRQLECRLKL